MLDRIPKKSEGPELSGVGVCICMCMCLCICVYTQISGREKGFRGIS